MKTRKVTNKILEMIDQGLLSEKKVLLACLNHMSEAEVSDMAYSNEFVDDDDMEDTRSH